MGSQNVFLEVLIQANGVVGQASKVKVGSEAGVLGHNLITVGVPVGGGQSPNEVTYVHTLDVPDQIPVIWRTIEVSRYPLRRTPVDDHKLIIDSSSVHRIQEAQGVLIGEICSRIPVTAQAEVHA